VLSKINEHRENTCVSDVDGKIFKDKDGNPVKVDLDFWSEDKYKIIEQKLTELIIKIENGFDDPNFTFQDLNCVLTEIIELDKQQEKIVNECITKENASELRKEQGLTFKKLLESQFYDSIEYGFDENDERKSYRIKMKNDSGNIIEMLISPNESNLEKPIVETHVQTTKYVSPETKRIISEDLNKAMINKGIIKGLKSSETKCIELSESKLYDQEALHNFNQL